MCLVTRHLRAQMTRDLHKLLIGGVKRLVNSGNLCFHSRGPHIPPNLVVGRLKRILIASRGEDLQVEHPV